VGIGAGEVVTGGADARALGVGQALARLALHRRAPVGGAAEDDLGFAERGRRG
jgi:hypothetical protein